MKLKKNAKVGEILEANSGKKLCWNGYAWEKVVEDVSNDTVFTRKTSQDAIREVPEGEVDDINYIFELKGLPLAGSEQVYLNGVLQKRGSGKDYILVSNRVYFVEPPSFGSTLVCTYATSSSTELRGDTPEGLVDGENSIFILLQTPVPGTEHVFLNGILQQPGASGDYTLNDNLVVFNEPPPADSLIACDYSFV